MSPGQRHTVRQERSAPLVTELERWMIETSRKPKSSSKNIIASPHRKLDPSTAVLMAAGYARVRSSPDGYSASLIARRNTAAGKARPVSRSRIVIDPSL
ncbi:hypothetical protein [Mesorhizobium sp. 2RAF45]|uniref:hypothetical protein n=1 Tax=Mesorhizobium sp. 2RAF45 TaxID=3233001 RepID=UPI003F9C2EFB